MAESASKLPVVFSQKFGINKRLLWSNEQTALTNAKKCRRITGIVGYTF